MLNITDNLALMSLIGVTRDLILILDLKGKILTTNAIFRNFVNNRTKLTGQSSEELLSILGINNTLKEIIKKVPLTGLERIYTDKDRNECYISWSFFPMLNNEQHQEGLIVVGEDITKLKELSCQVERLDNIINYAPDWIYWKDKNSIHLGCNKRFAMAAGLKNRDEMIGKSDHELPWYMNAPKYQLDDKEVIESGKPKLNIEDVVPLSDGQQAIVISNKVPLRDTDGKVIGVLGIATDITERKKTEEILRKAMVRTEELERLDNVIKYAPDMIYWKDKSSIHMGCNNQFAIAAGFSSREEVIGKSDYDFPWHEQARKYQLDDKEVIESGVPKLGIEDVMPFKNGKQATVITNKVPLRDTDGRVIGVLGIATDISERKKTEEELRLSKIAAESANIIKTNFIQNMQHDIRTPAASVWSILDQLVENNQTPDKELLTMLRDSSKQLFSICNDVIDFDRAENGELPLISKRFDLHQLIQNVIDLNKIAAQERGLDLSSFVDDKIPHVMKGDEHRLSRIFINLMGNALKFTTEGFISLSAELVEEKKKIYIIRFELQDSGIGIPLEKQGTLYEKFNRLNPANRTTYKGSGLGLRIVKKYVDDLEGEINVKSELHQGTTFFIDIPFEKALTQAAIPSISSPKRQTNPKLSNNLSAVKPDLVETATTSLSSASPTILLIEDNRLAANAAKMLLESEHCKITIAVDVKAALQILGRFLFDLVISDIGLPDGTGFDVLKAVRQDKKAINFSTPFVALTANADPETIAKGMEMGFQEMIAKPLRIDKIKPLLQPFISNIEPPSTIDSSTVFPPLDKTILDFEKTKNLSNGRFDRAFYILEQLASSLPHVKIQIQCAYANQDINGIGVIKKILFRFEGGLRYVGCSKLQAAVTKFQKVIKETEYSDRAKALLEAIYQQMDYFLKAYGQLKKIAPTLLQEEKPAPHLYSGRYKILLVEDDLLTGEATRMCLESSNCQVVTVMSLVSALNWLEEEQFDLVISDIGLPDGTGIDLIKLHNQNKESINFSIPFFALTAHTDETIKEEALNAGFSIVLSKPLTSKTLEPLIDEFLYQQKKGNSDKKYDD